MKKEFKEQIKRDEFATGLKNAAEWARTHQREAERAFMEAVAIYEAPVASELAPGADKPTGPVFPSAEEKYKTAAAAFDGVERRHATLPVAVRAGYYAALSRIELKQYVEAEKALRALAEKKDGSRLEPALARLALADLHRRQGQVDKAVEEYRALAGDSGFPLPRDYALMSLAATLEDAKRLAEAVAAYKRLTEEFPASVYAGEARRKGEYLQTAAQG